jgi:assimilatory nitrate reductase catalytic subunit
MTARHSSCETTCPYCGVGCGVSAQRSENHSITVRGSEDHPANLGRLCVKGSNLPDTVGLSQRLLNPILHGQEVDWNEAMTTMAERFRNSIEKYGPDSVAFYLSGQLLTEDYYVANKLMKGFIGSGNVDTNSRLCMSSAVASYKRSFGADAVPCNYEDLELADLLVITGSNAAWTHPILFQRISAAREQHPHKRIVVIDPRHTATTDIADLHLPLNPGSDAYLFNGLLHYLQAQSKINQDWVDRHTEQLDAALAAVSACDLNTVARLTGLSAEKLQEFYALFANSDKVVTFYSQGINQSATGTDKGNAIINCHLATGQIGKPGSGPFSITGQPNAMGGREVGGLANQLAAHMNFTADDIQRVQRFWDAPRMATRPGLMAVDLFDAMHAGKIKAVWIMATNPAVSLPNSTHIREALERCDFVAVSECTARTDTNDYADLLLPATTWGEKDGTVSNSERCISRQRAILPQPGQARHDWQIVCDLARRLGFGQQFPYQSGYEIFLEHARLSAYENKQSRAFNLSGLTGLSADDYENLKPVQWPVLDKEKTGSPRLFGDGHFYTENGKAKFVPVVAEMPKAGRPGPYILNTGRLRDQWHTMTRTGQSARLLRHTDSPRLALSKEDFQNLKLDENSVLVVESDNGRCLLRPEVDSGLKPGNVFAPIHWSSQNSSSAWVSALFDDTTDPISCQPQSKWIPVSLTRLQPQNWLSMLTTRRLQRLDLLYWHEIRLESGYLYIAAVEEPATVMQQFEQLLVKQDNELQRLDFTDSANNQARHIWFVNNKLTASLFLASTITELPEKSWLQSLLNRQHEPRSWMWLAGGDPEVKASGQLVCTCFEVSSDEISSAITAGACDVKTLGEKLKCGTNCGSCIPELKQLLRDSQSDPEQKVSTSNGH